MTSDQTRTRHGLRKNDCGADLRRRAGGNLPDAGSAALRGVFVATTRSLAGRADDSSRAAPPSATVNDQ